MKTKIGKDRHQQVKAFLAVIARMAALVFLRMVVHDNDNLFVATEVVHAIGIVVLTINLPRRKLVLLNVFFLN